MIFPQQQSKKKTPYRSDSVIESIRDIGSSVTTTVVNDVVKQSTSDALASILGMPQRQGELRPNESIDFAHPRKQEQPDPLPIIRPKERELSIQEDAKQVSKQIEMVRNELKSLAQAISSLNMDVEKAIHEIPVDPGVYHLTFFEKLRSMLIILKQQVRDSGNWLALTGSRKKKMGYWGMYKKHGTQFGLSNERKVSSQSG